MPTVASARSCLLIDSPQSGLARLRQLNGDPSLRIHSVRSLTRALALLDQFRFDAIVFDVDADTGSTGWISGLSQLSRRNSTPILLLTWPGNDAARLAGLALGARVCLAKPVSDLFLLTQVHSVLRTPIAPLRHEGEELLVRGQVVLQSPSRQVFVAGDPRALSVAQFELLALLIRARGAAVSRAQLAARLPAGCARSDRAVDMHVARLRRHLRGAPLAAIHSVYRYGYRLVSTEPMADTPGGAAQFRAPGASGYLGQQPLDNTGWPSTPWAR